MYREFLNGIANKSTDCNFNFEVVMPGWNWTPEQREERLKWKAENEALKDRISKGSITGQEAETERKRLDEWYKEWEKSLGISMDGPGSA